MGTRRTRRKQEPQPRRGLLLGAIGALAAVTLLAPLVVVEVARGRLLAQPCVNGAHAPSAPNESFYSAAQVLDLVAIVPAIGRRARAVSTEATARCLEAFTTECAAVRDAAVDLARVAEETRLGLREPQAGVETAAGAANWREYIDEDARFATCSAWSEWMRWIDQHGVVSLDACPVCAPE
jgi:hypothetical protein